MSVEDEIVGIDARIKEIHDSGNYPKYFWGGDGVRFSKNKDNTYTCDNENGGKYTFEALYRHEWYSIFPPSTPQEETKDLGEEVHPIFELNFIPEIWQVKKDTIYAAITAVEDGLEFAKSSLEEHDLNFGRTTKKNKCWAEAIESSIRHMESTLTMLKNCPEKSIDK